MIEVIQADDQDFPIVRGKIQEMFLKYPTMMFNKLGDLDFADILKKEEKYFDQQQQERLQYISYPSLAKNMKSVLGIQNQFFAQMLFLYLSGRAMLTQPISLKQFLKKLNIFWMRNGQTGGS